MSLPERNVRRCDDPEYPNAVVVEKWQELRLHHGTGATPHGWVVVAWYPSAAAMRDTIREVQAGHEAALRGCKDVLDQLDALEAGARVLPLTVAE